MRSSSLLRSKQLTRRLVIDREELNFLVRDVVEYAHIYIHTMLTQFGSEQVILLATDSIYIPALR